MEINSQTATALCRLAVAIAANVCAAAGWAFDTELWMNLALSAASLVVLGYVWWKNQNVTEAAQEAQRTLDYLKDNPVGDIADDCEPSFGQDAAWEAGHAQE